MFNKWWIAPPGTVGWWAALILVPLVCLALIGMLTKLPPRYRRPLINLLVFVAGLYFVLEFFIPAKPDTQENFLSDYLTTFVAPFAEILGGLLLGQGLYSLARIHVGNITKQRYGWYNSLALIIAAVGMTIIGIWSQGNSGDHPKIDLAFQYLFNGIFQNLDAAMFSLIAFYILSAAYRAFRLRSTESSILMISALVVIMGLTFGTLITGFLPTEGFYSNFRVENWSFWTLNVISAPALRAISLGVGVGALAMALRLWLGIERGALFGE